MFGSTWRTPYIHDKKASIAIKHIPGVAGTCTGSGEPTSGLEPLTCSLRLRCYICHSMLLCPEKVHK
jgi:hypothetical protein